MKLSAIAAPIVLLGYNRFKDVITVTHSQVGFAVALAVVFCVGAVLYVKINTRNDRTRIKIKSKQMGGPEIEEEKSVAAYDMSELFKLLAMKVGMGAAVVFAIHYYTGYVQPLILQAIMLPLQLVESQLFRIHILGAPATGKNARPFKEENPFAALTGGDTAVQADVDEIAAASEEADAADAAVEPAASGSSKKQGGKAPKQAKKQR